MKKSYSNIANATKLLRGKSSLLLVPFIIYSVVDLMKFMMLGYMVDLFSDLTKNSHQIYRTIFFVAICAFGGYLLDVIMPFIKSVLIESKIYRLRVMAGDKLLNIPYREIEKMNCGDILSRIMNDIDVIQVFLEKKEPDFIILFFKGILGAMICLLISWKFAAAFFLTIPVVIGLGIASGKAEEKLMNEQKSKLSDLNEFVLDTMNHFLTVKVFDLTETFTGTFDEKSSKMRTTDIKIANRRAAFSFLNALSQLLPTIVMMTVGAVLVYGGELTTGSFTIMLAMSSRVANLLGGVQEFIYSRQGYIGSIRRIEELLKQPDEKKNEAVQRSTGSSDLLFSEVSFSYNQSQVLSDINIRARKGEHIAIVGRSGCGKSTMIKLISALYSDYNGEIYVGGIKNMPGNERYIRDKIAVVSQDNYLFPISIKDNITLFNENFSMEDMIKAARAAGIYDMIEALPMGFDTILEAGSTNISGGQRQRICIARAYMKNTQLLLLDEPTSALDTKTEKDITHSIEEWMSGKTLIIVAHHLSTIKESDRIYYMEHGKILEVGSYDELCRCKGGFYNLYKDEIMGGGIV